MNVYNTPTGRIEYNPIFTKTTQGGAQKCADSKWLIPNKVKSSNCPVRLFKKLISKRTENAPIKSDPRLFLTVNPAWNKKNEKLIYGKRLLKDDALLLVRSEKNITSWDILKKKLKYEFGKSINSAALHKALSARKKRKDETLTRYLLTMKDLASQGNVDENALQDYIIEADFHVVSDKAIPTKFIVGKPILDQETLTISSEGIQITAPTIFNHQNTDRELKEFDYIIEHRPESGMKHCDALSRNPIALIVRNEFLEKVKVTPKEDEHLKAIIEILQKQSYDDYEMDRHFI
ncbi:Retrotransposon gag protein [Popillia japonica]|uniref:Retrotransposon gag protein n=1 Tax=Popillia japonica TaxID=7064 RepID=A0AAW1HSZ5_POPJA